MNRSRTVVCFIEFPDGEIPDSRVFETDFTLFLDDYGAITIRDAEAIEALPDILYDEFGQRVNVIALGTEEVVDSVNRKITDSQKQLRFDLLIQNTNRIEDIIFRELGRYKVILKPLYFIDSYDNIYQYIDGKVMNMPETNRYPGFPIMNYRVYFEVTIPDADQSKKPNKSRSNRFKNAVDKSWFVSTIVDQKEAVLASLIAEAIIRTVQYLLDDDAKAVYVGPRKPQPYQFDVTNQPHIPLNRQMTQILQNMERQDEHIQ